VYPFLYFHARFEGLKENKIIRHLVIDEMQDYTPVQYAVMNTLFPCKKTILGDYGQMVNPCQLSGLEDLRQLYEDVEIVKLNTSYRSSYEIITFARNILSVSGIEPVERHGDEVDVVCCADEEEEIEVVKAKIKSFRQSGWATMGIIVKTRKQARELYLHLCDEYEVNLLDANSARYAGGVSIASVQMSKGLEFDEVVVVGASVEHYATPFDRNLLYIACTRAMHKLSLTCHGQPAAAIQAVVKHLDRANSPKNRRY
jgi:DNA helicase-2/ATP-dependent DNA helicase PcrA